MEKEQSAVRWLVSQLNKKGFAQVVTDEEIEQANKIFEEQIEKTWENGYEHGACVNEEQSIYHGNQYFKKTFEQE